MNTSFLDCMAAREVFLCIHVYAYKSICTNVCMYILTCIYTYIIYIYIRIHIYTYVYTYIHYVYIFIYKHIYIYIYHHHYQALAGVVAGNLAVREFTILNPLHDKTLTFDR
jgi:prepilin signal peptidase PulO-like enzyme (type II secretory pathway)